MTELEKQVSRWRPTVISSSDLKRRRREENQEEGGADMREENHEEGGADNKEENQEEGGADKREEQHCSSSENAINILQGLAGMDENQVHLFEDAAAINHDWKNQQKHLDCLQDPPGKDKHITRNGMCLPHYSKVRGINTLEGFHSFLPSMIPGPHCAAVPFEVYLLSGIACRKSDRESGGFKGQKGRKHMVYVSPLIDRLNQSCQDLFGEVEEANYQPPVPAQDEQIGL
ncbi:uncharacterized protein LOC115582628 isoform X2 [Sparus aurata]|uniref:uncharacterized protein LOC115582628 isoform X2 n=1 Tax=Sparus aurata TaxID=8175 RepID=UPI0011C15152|nr:uncharacterized protein LOC115582628 isoform X2 [Sparus aurata]